MTKHPYKSGPAVLWPLEIVCATEQEANEEADEWRKLGHAAEVKVEPPGTTLATLHLPEGERQIKLTRNTTRITVVVEEDAE